MIVVMGIDPGIANTGFGVISAAGGTMHAIDGGLVEASAEHAPETRLRVIHDAVAELVEWHRPVAVALESLYFGRNVRSALAVGQARGVVMLAAAERGIPCFDYTPQAVKMAVCGSGGADKHQVQQMVASLLGLPCPPASDHAADALAVAICHAGAAGHAAAAEHALAAVGIAS